MPFALRESHVVTFNVIHWENKEEVRGGVERGLVDERSEEEGSEGYERREEGGSEVDERKEGVKWMRRERKEGVKWKG